MRLSASVAGTAVVAFLLLGGAAGQFLWRDEVRSALTATAVAAASSLTREQEPARVGPALETAAARRASRLATLASTAESGRQALAARLAALDARLAVAEVQQTGVAGALWSLADSLLFSARPQGEQQAGWVWACAARVAPRIDDVPIDDVPNVSICMHRQGCRICLTCPLHCHEFFHFQTFSLPLQTMLLTMRGWAAGAAGAAWVCSKVCGAGRRAYAPFSDATGTDQIRVTNTVAQEQCVLRGALRMQGCTQPEFQALLQRRHQDIPPTSSHPSAHRLSCSPHSRRPLRQ